MASLGAFTIEAECEPTLRTALDALDLLHEVIELLPDYLSPQRKELTARADALADVAVSTLRTSMKPKGDH